MMVILSLGEILSENAYHGQNLAFIYSQGVRYFIFDSLTRGFMVSAIRWHGRDRHEHEPLWPRWSMANG